MAISRITKAGIILFNLFLAVLLMRASPVSAQETPASCNDDTFFAAQQAYLDTLTPNADFTSAAFQAARQHFADVIADCYAQIDVTQLRYDDGPMIAPTTPRRNGETWEGEFVLQGGKWGGGTPITSASPQIPGGTVYWSYVANGVASESLGVNLVAISSLPTYSACFNTEISNAFAAWQAVTNIQFVQVPDSNGATDSEAGYYGHIRIGAHPIDGASGVLAHGYYPPPNGVTIAGDLHFDTGENWQCSPGTGQIDIGLVALHEIGHTIGLNHEPTLLAVMNAFYNPSLSSLQTDDINGARALYGTSGVPGINIVDRLTGPYPASMVVNGLGGTITDVNITLTGLYHTWANDLDMLLVSPGGQAVVFMSDACGGGILTNLTLTFDDSAPTQLPSGATCTSGTFRPANYGGTEIFPSPAPSSGYSTILSAFNGSNPNGTWNLYIIDDTFSDTGGLVSWSLAITTSAPPMNTATHTATATSTRTNTPTATRTPTATPTTPLTNLIQNGNFNTPGAGSAPPPPWSVFGQPSAPPWSLSGGVFNFHRTTGSSQGVIFQNTNVPIASNVVLQAQFDLGNSSSARKRALILIHDGDFSDSAACTFWLPANTALHTYTMKMRTTEAWTNATLSIYVSNPADNQAALQVDNVSMQVQAGQSFQGTICTDPIVPDSPGGGDSANLLTNPLFSQPLNPLSPVNAWSYFNQISAQIVGEVAEIYRTGTPRGNLFQETLAVTNAGVPLEVTFQMGNSENRRMRVVILIHKRNFGDLGVCAFWLPPNASMQWYTLRTVANIDWDDGTAISFYPDTLYTSPVPTGRVRIDNVTLRQRPGINVLGTECYEPGQAVPSSLPPEMPVFPPTLEWTATALPEPSTVELPLEATVAPTIDASGSDSGEGGVGEG